VTTFTGSASGTLPLDFGWDFGDGSTTLTTSDALGTGVTTTHTYAAAGTYTVVMTATNCGGAGNSVVTHTIPVICASIEGLDFSWTPPLPVAGFLARFTATVSGGTAPFSFTWDFGDGDTGSGEATTHAYTAADLYTITVAVSDVCGQAATHRTPLVVAPAYGVYLPVVVRALGP
jgi:PKD repeat protein